MTARKLTFTEMEFRAAMTREIADLILGRTTYQRSLEWLCAVQIGLGPLPQLRIAQIGASIKLLLSSLRADEALRAAPCETKKGRNASRRGETR